MTFLYAKHESDKPGTDWNETITELHCRGAWWAAAEAAFAASPVEIDCRWEWWKAASDYFAWSDQSATAAVSGFMWGQHYDPVRGW